MSRWLGLSLLLAVSCCQVLIVCGIKTNAAERTALIEAAITEAKEQASHAAHAGSSRSTTLQRHRSFKLASPTSLAQGKARLLYEDMVHRAERKILESRRQANTASLQKDNEAMAEALATELLHTPGRLLTKQEIAKIYQESECQELIHAPDCGDLSMERFRTADGTCNNLKNPTYGAVDTPFRRLILPQYEDGISAPRGWMQSRGSPLFSGPFSPPNPSPRVVSVGVVRDRPAIEDRYTHILMQWGQFMDHDLDFAPEFEGCETCKVEGEEALECAPFPLPRDDTDVMVTRTDPESRGCHQFRRSLPACDEAGPTELRSREQINGITSFIDGSQVYHHNEMVMRNLIRDRSIRKGQLRTGLPVPGTTQPSLPFVNESHIVACPPPLTPNECYLAGDLRVNEQTSLTVMHTIWVREHNRIATALSALNPQWGEERLFQEARQIVIAEIQKITYKDYLPLIIGSLLNELILEYSPEFGYNDQSNPSIPNAFATAAYRFGHSQIQPFFDRLDENYNPLPQGPLNLVDAFFTPTRFVESGGTDPILRGLVTRPARFVDEFLNNILTNQLFAPNNSAPGLDLASLNIQRGRDHGLPPYLTWKRWALEECGIESEFHNELTKIHLLQTYGTLETVDLFVGGLSEEPLEGGLVGATFACIFARTFEAVRDGDRFYYENANENTGIFTASQRAEIEKASLSRVICDNSDNIQTIQPNAFLASQSRVSCSELPQIDLSAWQVSATIPSPLPNKCYIRIGVQDNTRRGRAHTFDALSSFARGRLRFHYSQATVSQDEDFECLSIRCPRRAVDLGVYPFLSLCSFEQNSNLPSASGGFIPGEYVTTIDSSHVSESNGIYLDDASCKAGAVNAIDFACGLFKANKQNEDEKLVQSLEQMLHTQQNSDSAPAAPSVDPATRIDKDIDPDDPLFNDFPEDIRSYFLERPTPDPSSEGNGKLIAVMENVLEELKAQDKKKESIDDKLVSELSEALSRI